MDEKQTNLLPAEEKQKAEEALKKKQETAKPGMKLVIPKMEDGKEAGKKKKSSWWTRFKERREKKKAEKRRRKGETGKAKKEKKKKKEEMAKKPSLRPELFSEVMRETPEKHWWERAKQKEKELNASKKKTFKEESTKEEPKEKVKKEEPEPNIKKEAVSEKQAEVQTEKEEPEPKHESEPNPISRLHEPAKADRFSGPSVNLVPAGARADEGNPLILAAAILIFTSAIWIIAGGVTYAHIAKARAEQQKLNARILQVDKVISDYAGTKDAAQKLQRQYDSVEQLVEQHVYWSIFLQNLKDLTIPDVYYRSLNADLANNTVQLQAIAKDYASAARQIRSFEKAPTQLIESVTVGEARIENQPGAGLPVPVVAYDLELKLVAGVLQVVPSEDL